MLTLVKEGDEKWNREHQGQDGHTGDDGHENHQNPPIDWPARQDNLILPDSGSYLGGAHCFAGKLRRAAQQ